MILRIIRLEVSVYLQTSFKLFTMFTLQISFKPSLLGGGGGGGVKSISRGECEKPGGKLLGFLIKFKIKCPRIRPLVNLLDDDMFL
jgi:hypothetical protein